MGYRELTRSRGFTGTTQLAVVHTHTLVLGTIVGLVLLALHRLYGLGQDRRLGWLIGTWTAGVTVTTIAMTIKGTMQVLGSSAADSPALAGIAGTGHILLTAAFALLFVVLGAAIRRQPTTPPVSATAGRSALPPRC